MTEGRAWSYLSLQLAQGGLAGVRTRHHIACGEVAMNESTASLRLPFRDRRRPPAPVPLTHRLGPWRYYRALRTNPIRAWRQEVYETPVVADRGPRGDVIVVSAPDAIRRIFLDNVGNYLKDPLQLEKLGPGLGRGLLTTGGEDWKFQRRTAAPLFQPHTVTDYVPDM